MRKELKSNNMDTMELALMEPEERELVHVVPSPLVFFLK